MAAVKRKEGPSGVKDERKRQKIGEVKMVGTTQKSTRDDDFDGLSDEDNGGVALVNGRPQVTDQSSRKPGVQPGKPPATANMTSAETHAKQRLLTKERKANKPNADIIQRSKKIWERLRRKSHVPLEERKQLVDELFGIITGRVREFVFKHDAVRTIQCALKYAAPAQRRQIALELKGDLRTLAESRYGKFLVAKMVSERDKEVRDMVVEEFYGHIRRLINHPEASWIVDDVYRHVATPAQKARMLREWYGAEFALFHRRANAKVSEVVAEDDTADLVKLLEKNPEKRKPILQYLLQMINSLIQKKMTGFTMLHDAMLQYFLALESGTPEHGEFLEILKNDIDTKEEGGGGDLYRNLAFTKSGSRLVCLALTYGNAKDRKVILRVFRGAIEMMAYDQHAKMVLVVGLDVSDDTKMSSKTIFPELVGQDTEAEDDRLSRLETLVTNLTARLPLIYPLAGAAKWLVNDQDKALLEEVHEIRKTTSKKAPDSRRKDLLEYLSGPLLELTAKRTESLAQSSFGCQFLAETLLCAQGESRAAAMDSIAQLAAGDATSEGHLSHNAPAGRMLKTLVTGGAFDPLTKTVNLANPPLQFGEVLWPLIKDHVVEWACGDSSFVVVALLESEDVSEAIKCEVRTWLNRSKKQLEAAAEGKDGEAGAKTGRENKQLKGNAGAKLLLQKLA